MGINTIELPPVGATQVRCSLPIPPAFSNPIRMEEVNGKGESGVARIRGAIIALVAGIAFLAHPDATVPSAFPPLGRQI